MFSGSRYDFGAASGIVEMLMQGEVGDITLLPALPDARAQGEVGGLRARRLRGGHALGARRAGRGYRALSARRSLRGALRQPHSEIADEGVEALSAGPEPALHTRSHRGRFAR